MATSTPSPADRRTFITDTTRTTLELLPAAQRARFENVAWNDLDYPGAKRKIKDTSAENLARWRADPGYEAVSVSADIMLVRLKTGEPVALYGVGADGPTAARSIECRAGAFRMGADGAQFIALRELALPGKPAVSLAQPVAVAMDFRERTVTVQAPTVRQAMVTPGSAMALASKRASAIGSPTSSRSVP